MPITTTGSTRTCASCSSRLPGRAARSRSGRGSWSPSRARVKGLQLVVADIEAARADLAGRGVEVSDVQDFPWGRFTFFSDPDGNAWAVQEIPARA